MSKIRVYEYAKEKNVSSKDVINKLKELNIPVSNHMSTIDDEAIKKLDSSVATKKESKKPEAKNQQSNSKPNNSSNEKKQTNSSPKNNSSQRTSTNNNKPASTNNNKPASTNNNKPASTNNNKPASTNNNKPANNNNNNRPNNNRPNNNRPNNNNNNRPNNNKNQKNKNKNNQKQTNQVQQNQPPKMQETPSKITYSGTLTVGELAKKMHKDPAEIIKKLFMLGTMATINQELDGDSIELIAGDYGVEVEEEIILESTDFAKYEMDEKEENLQIRPPVVTIMGHVDHGKTTLLDSIRNSKVTAGEAGGITQHIGAYQIEEQGKKITFLDTPGHAAFTTMRARGAQVTDITILVVAADDGVMPQTVEAINHAKAAEVPIIVAVNKMDKEGANPDRVMQELTEHGLVSEEWGGDTIFTKLSAIKGEGIDELLEMILLVAEVEEYKANPNRLAAGTVIEAELDKGKGAVATLLVQNGTLRVGDPIVVGNSFGRVRAMVSDIGRRVKVAPPSTPVEITGLNDVPHAGDQFLVFKDEKQARAVGEARAVKQREADRGEKTKVSLDDLFNKIKEGEMKAINVIVKADVQGSVEAMAASLQKIDVEGVKVNIIHTGVGAITESDIILASASGAIVIGFNVRPDVNAKRTADVEDVDIRLHRIIYKAIEEMEQAMKGMLDPEFEEKVIGQVEVRETFKVSKIGTIAGCYVTDGKVTRDSSVRLIRDGIVVYEGEIDTLRRFKDDVKEVAQNYECGITLEKYNDVKEGDIIEAYVMEEIKRT